MAVLVFIISINLSYSMDSDNIYTIDENYKTELIIKAKEMNLAANPYWHTLLHYKKDFFGGFTSLVDDEKFFFSKNFYKKHKRV